MKLRNLGELKIARPSLCSVTLAILGIYLYLEIVTPHSPISQFFMALTVALSIATLFDGRLRFRFSLNPLIICYALYILYQYILSFSGVARDPEATNEELTTMLVSLVVFAVVYNIFLYRLTMEQVKRLIIYVGLFSLLTVLYLCRDTIGVGRLAHVYREGVSYYFLGRAVSVTSNGFAALWAIASYFLLDELKRRGSLLKYLALFLFVAGIMLTGSRRGFFILILSICGWIFINTKRNLFLKAIVALVVLIIVYQLMMNVQIFYDTIGERTEIFVNNLLGRSTSVEGSMSARYRYGTYAVAMIKESPLCGYGTGYFESIYGNVTENDYYDKLVAGGAIGFCIYYLFAVVGLGRFLRFYRRGVGMSNDRRELLKYLFLMVVLLISMWGAVTVTSRLYLLYLSLFFLYCDKVRLELPNENAKCEKLSGARTESEGEKMK